MIRAYWERMIRACQIQVLEKEKCTWYVFGRESCHYANARHAGVAAVIESDMTISVKQTQSKSAKGRWNAALGLSTYHCETAIRSNSHC